MLPISGLDNLADCRGGVATIGNFDGVHRGHQRMIAELRRRANASGVPAVAVTFEPPPVEVLRPSAAPPRLMSVRRKADRLREAGADRVFAFATDATLLGLSAETFFEEMLVGRLAVRGLIEGPNFRFGKDRAGDVVVLERLCARAGIEFDVIESVGIGGQMVSSSRVREFVSAGDLRSAAELLGRPHEAVGTVGRGAARGRELGFPTANLIGIETLLPPDGVYAGLVEIDGTRFPAAIHIGANSTFGETSRTFEAHLLGFSGDLYGRTLRVDLVDRIRGSAKFENRDALVRQIEADCRRVGELVATDSPPR